MILDGLGEVPARLRPIMLEALSQQATGLRVVLLVRTAEMVTAAATHHFFERLPSNGRRSGPPRRPTISSAPK